MEQASSISERDGLLLAPSTSEGEMRSFARNSASVTVLMALSAVSGFLLNLILAMWFGAGEETDAFFAAYTVPFAVVTMLMASSSALVPFFNRIAVEHNQADVNRIYSNIINVSGVFLLLSALVGMLLSPWIVRLVAPGFTEDQIMLADTLQRILFVMVFFGGVNELLSGILCARQSFTVPAVTQLVRHLSCIGLVLTCAGFMGLYSLALGYVVGAALQAIILIVFWVGRLGFRYRLVWRLRDPLLLKMLCASIAPIGGTWLRQLIQVCERIIGSLLPPGSITALSYAYRVVMLVADILFRGITLVSLPKFSVLIVQGDRVGQREILTAAVRFALLLAVPVVVWLMVLGLPITRIAFERGAFDLDASVVTASALSLYAMSLVFFAYFRVAQSFFYGNFQVKVLLFLFGLMVLVAVILDVVLVGPLGVGGLALSFSIATAVAAVVSFVLVRRYVGSLTTQGLIGLHVKLVVAALIMAAVMFGLNRASAFFLPAGPLSVRLLSLGISSFGGLSVYIVACLLLQVRELRALWRSGQSWAGRFRAVLNAS